jgi:mRNA interferase MazF
MIKKGQIILIPFPFTDLKGQKVRPAIVLSDNNLGDIVVAFISSKIDKIKNNDLLIKTDEQNCLKSDSKIVCSKLTTIDRKIILGKIGSLKVKQIQEIDKKLRSVFGI